MAAPTNYKEAQGDIIGRLKRQRRLEMLNRRVAGTDKTVAEIARSKQPTLKRRKPITIDEYNKKFGEKGHVPKPRTKVAPKIGPKARTSVTPKIGPKARTRVAPKIGPKARTRAAPPRRLAPPTRVAGPRRMPANIAPGQSTAPSRANPKRLRRPKSGKKLITTPGAAKGAFFY
jgi:hypothetical protein